MSVPNATAGPLTVALLCLASQPGPARAQSAPTSRPAAGCKCRSAVECFELGNGAYGEKKGAGDPAAAACYWSAGCARGHGRSCLELGRSVVSGEGVKHDPRRALELLRRGCTLGCATACVDVGFHLSGESKLRVRPDLAEAVRYSRLGCDGGDRTGCHNMGTLLKQSADKKDHELAFRLLERTCSAGMPNSCCALSRVLGEKLPLQQDLPRRLALARRACDGGFEDCCSDVKEIETRLADARLKAAPVFRVWPKAGATISSDAGVSAALGGGLTVVWHWFRGARDCDRCRHESTVGTGLLVEALYDLGREGTRLAVGPLASYRLIGLDGGYLVELDGSGALHGGTARLFLHLGILRPYVRWGALHGGPSFFEVGAEITLHPAPWKAAYGVLGNLFSALLMRLM
jgi:hypothetical protein